MLSTRAKQWAAVDFAHGPKQTYDVVNCPNGVVDFSNAENLLMHHALVGFINENVRFNPRNCAYGEGFTGTHRVRQAMSAFLNTHFHPATPFDPEQITCAAGVTALNETCAMLACDPGEAIMLGMPIYGSFSRDLTLKTGVKLEYVPMADVDQFSAASVATYEAGLKDAEARGAHVKALMICNPHNPLGQCYTREALIGLLKLCAAKRIHLISDEIYGLSVYDRADRPCETFVSVRSIDCERIIPPEHVHVLYGMSKDFSGSGLRLGCLISQNAEFTNAARAICRFSSPSQFSMEIASTLLENHDFVSQYIKKSQFSFLSSRLLAEQLLDEHQIPYHNHGNAGLFLWLDLSAHLPLQQSGCDGWAAQDILARRFEQAGVIMSNGSSYRAPKPGYFRVVHSLPKETLRKGIERIARVLRQQGEVKE